MTTALRPYVPDVAAEWLVGDPDQRHRSVEGTLAFVDISGFTALARRLTRQGTVGSEELSDILDATFGALLAHARREGGDLVKWGGDAVLLLFTGEEHAVRAVRASADMRSELRTVGRTSSSAGGVSLRMSVGVHSGRFDFFLVGDPRIHRELVISGPAASRCAEMEVLATAGQIMLSEATAALLPPGLAGEAGRRGSPAPTPSAGRGVVPSAPSTSASSTWRTVVPALAGPPAGGRGRARSTAPSRWPSSSSPAPTTCWRARDQRPLAAALDAVVRNAQEACAGRGVTFLESDINRDGGKLMLVAGAPGGGRDVEDRILGVARLVVDRAGVAAAPGRRQPRRRLRR